MRGEAEAVSRQHAVAYVALAAAVMLAGGCAATWGFGVGPTVDTDGNVGVQLTARGSVGAPFGEEDGIVEMIGLSTTPPGVASPGVAPELGIDYVHESLEDDLGVRAGLRTRFALDGGDDWHWWFGAGLALAILPTLDVADNESDEFTHVGVELSGYWLTDESAEVPEGEGAPEKGLFGISLIYEEVLLDEDWFEETW